MTRDEIRQTIVDALRRIAPEADAAGIDPAATLREQFDLDSMDFLNLVQALHKRLGVSIPEADYAQLFSLDAAVSYLESRWKTAPSRSSA
jgi:acyl carrier protein